MRPGPEIPANQGSGSTIRKSVHPGPDRRNRLNETLPGPGDELMRLLAAGAGSLAGPDAGYCMTGYRRVSGFTPL